MQVKLDDIDLVKRVQPTATSPLSEVRSVLDVRVDGSRSLVELKIPGSSGNVLQDMGREPISIHVKGEVWGPDAKKTIETVQDKVSAGKSIPFTSDLLAAASVGEVIIENFDVDQIAGLPNTYRYTMLLRETQPGGEAEEGAAAEVGEEELEEQETDLPGAEESPDQSEEAEEEAKKESEIHDIRVLVTDYLGGPIINMEITVQGPDGERKLKTDNEGYVMLLDVQDGTYEITIDDEKFKDVKKKIEVKKES